MCRLQNGRVVALLVLLTSGTGASGREPVSASEMAAGMKCTVDVQTELGTQVSGPTPFRREPVKLPKEIGVSACRYVYSLKSRKSDYVPVELLDGPKDFLVTVAVAESKRGLLGVVNKILSHATFGATPSVVEMVEGLERIFKQTLAGGKGEKVNKNAHVVGDYCVATYWWYSSEYKKYIWVFAVAPHRIDAKVREYAGGKPVWLVKKNCLTWLRMYNHGRRYKWPRLSLRSSYHFADDLQCRPVVQDAASESVEIH